MITATLTQAEPIEVTGRAKRFKVTVTLTVHYLAERAGESLYPWDYDGVIENQSTKTIVVKCRSWLLQNGKGRSQKQRVHGLTITGDRPIIPPGGWAYFRTGVPLNFDTGWMRGTLHCLVVRTGEQFDIEIPKFPLNVSNPGVVPRARLRWAAASTEPVTPAQAQAVRNRLDRFASATVDILSTHEFPAAIRYVVEDFMLREHLLNEIKDFAPLAQLNARHPYLLGCLIDLQTSDLYITDLRQKYGLDQYGVELVKFGRNPKEVDTYFAAQAADIMARRATDARLVAGVRGLLAASETSEKTRRLLSHMIEGGAATVSRCLDAAENPVPAAGAVEDSTLGRLRLKYEQRLVSTPLPKGGYQTAEEAKSAGRLISTYRNLRKLQTELGEEPEPENEFVTAVERARAAFYRSGRHRANEPQSA